MNRMNRPPRDERELEGYIGRILSQQPLRQAPANLEARILQRLAQEAARPWWRLGFSRWPWSARLLFLATGAGLARIAFLAMGRLDALWQAVQQTAPVDTARAGLQLIDNLGHALQTLGSMVTQVIPQAWMYGVVGLALLLYAALFGLGAAAFRTLILTTPEPVRY